MKSYQKAFIDLAITHKALLFGEFTLKSGRISPYFFNVGQLNTGQALKALGECYASTLHQSNIEFDVLFGPAYKGIPLVCTTAIALSAQFQENVPYCFNRKEIKDHGEGGQIVGSPLSGRVLLLDDVITAGTAMRESFELIKTHNATPAGIIVALDRQEKGQGEMSAIQEIQTILSIPVHAIITLDHIMEYVTYEPHLNSYLAPMKAYRQQYGV